MTTFTTVEIDPNFDLTARFRDNGLLWTRRNEGFVAWGEAIRIRVGSGAGRFARAASELAEALGGIRIEDPIRAPGTGPVAFGSFTFDDSDAASVLAVPEVVVGRRDGRAWITFAGKHPIVEDSELLPGAGRIRYAGSTVSETTWLDTIQLSLPPSERSKRNSSDDSFEFVGDGRRAREAKDDHLVPRAHVRVDDVGDRRATGSSVARRGFLPSMSRASPSGSDPPPLPVGARTTNSAPATTAATPAAHQSPRRPRARSDVPG